MYALLDLQTFLAYKSNDDDGNNDWISLVISSRKAELQVNIRPVQVECYAVCPRDVMIVTLLIENAKTSALHPSFIPCIGSRK